MMRLFGTYPDGLWAPTEEELRYRAVQRAIRACQDCSASCCALQMRVLKSGTRLQDSGLHPRGAYSRGERSCDPDARRRATAGLL